ncbi:MAG: nucleotidyltransferase [Bacteroidetes bacterium]|nr:nucleotidyltransferase [Bacteroidota bacterium]MCB9226046.1 nucleotidyltransferase [Chitinophagales bacterium]
MANVFNDDFRDFLKALNNNSVEYIIVGGYAVIYHGYNRTTGDLDIWINPNSENYKKLSKAFIEFGMSVFDMTEQNFLSNNFDVFTFGKPPVCIEILTKVKGLEFTETFKFAIETVFDEIQVKMIDVRDLIKAKKAANRYKDLDDLNHLES